MEIQIVILAEKKPNSQIHDKRKCTQQEGRKLTLGCILPYTTFLHLSMAGDRFSLMLESSTIPLLYRNLSTIVELTHPVLNQSCKKRHLLLIKKTLKNQKKSVQICSFDKKKKP